MPITDQAQRDRALDVTRSFIVQAPAGSGKTGVLTLRILRLLAIVDQPEEILAITFTRKAAAEMRLRVVEALDLAASEVEPDNEYDRLFFRYAKLVLDRDRLKQWNLRSNQNRLRMQTIDSFCSSVVRNRPLTSGLGARFNVADDASDLYRNACRELLKMMDDDEGLAEPLKRVLGCLNNQYGKLEALVIQMLMQRDHWLQDVTGLISNSDAMRSLLEDSLQRINEEARDRFLDQFDPTFLSELDQIAVYATNNLALDGKLPPDSMLKRPDGTALPDLELIKRKLKVLLTRELVPRKPRGFTKACGFPSDKTEEALGFKARAQALAERIDACGEPGLERLQDFINAPPEEYPQEQWQLLNDLMLIMFYAAAHLKLVFQERQSLDFSEIALSALNTLGEPGSPTDVALMLDARLQHILVDEFQDTSFVQIELLEKLTEGWQAGDGRSLFLVGDPMQSIYAFRQAEVGLFLRLWQQKRLNQVVLETLQLDTNFRSSATVIDWINNTFRHCFPALSDHKKGAVEYSESHAAKPAKEGDEVCLKLFVSEQDVKECTGFAEAGWLVNQIQRLPDNDSVAILVRNKSHVLDIARVLRQHNIPYQALEIEPLHQSQVVSDLLALMNAYRSPSDRIAWFALLRGPWCGLTLRQLEALVAVDPDPWLALNRVVSGQNDNVQYENGLAALQHLHRCMSEAYQQRHRKRWSESLYHLMLQLGMPATFQDDNCLQIIESFFGLLDELEQSSTDCIADVPDQNALQRKLDKLFVPAKVYGSGIRVVQVMSMHKSKGLEFDTVFLPQMQRKSRADDKPLIHVEKQTSLTDSQQELFIAPLDMPGASESNSVYQYLDKLKRQRTGNEVCRLLYVAATRAKKRLYISGSVVEKDGEEKAPDHSSLLRLFWPLLGGMQNAERLPIQAIESEEHKRFFRFPESGFYEQLVERNKTVRPVDTPPAKPQRQEPDHSLYHRHVGNLVHRLLEQMVHLPEVFDQCSDEQLQLSWRSQLKLAGVQQAFLDTACHRVQQAYHRIKESDQAKWILDHSHRESETEWPVTFVGVDSQVQHWIIDRTFISDGVRYIIDYKLSEPGQEDRTRFLMQETEHYRQQLLNYKSALEAMESIPVKTCLYFPMIDTLHEVTH